MGNTTSEAAELSDSSNEGQPTPEESRHNADLLLESTVPIGAADDDSSTVSSTAIDLAETDKAFKAGTKEHRAKLITWKCRHPDCKKPNEKASWNDLKCDHCGFVQTVVKIFLGVFNRDYKYQPYTIETKILGGKKKEIQVKQKKPWSTLEGVKVDYENLPKALKSLGWICYEEDQNETPLPLEKMDGKGFLNLDHKQMQPLIERAHAFMRKTNETCIVHGMDYYSMHAFRASHKGLTIQHMIPAGCEYGMILETDNKKLMEQAVSVDWVQRDLSESCQVCFIFVDGCNEFHDFNASFSKDIFKKHTKFAAECNNIYSIVARPGLCNVDCGKKGGVFTQIFIKALNDEIPVNKLKAYVNTMIKTEFADEKMKMYADYEELPVAMNDYKFSCTSTRYIGSSS